MSFLMLIINQHLSLEITILKFFNKCYGKYQNLHLANSVCGEVLRHSQPSGVMLSPVANSVNATKMTRHFINVAKND